MALILNLGDVVCMKKKHPCGGNQWQVGRLGADIGLTCQKCGRHILVARSYLQRRVKQIIPREKSPEYSHEDSIEATIEEAKPSNQGGR